MIPVLLGAAAIWGISNVADAESNAQAANKINKEAADLAKNAHGRVSQSHDEMMSVLDSLGETKRRTSIAIGFAGDYILDITKKIRLANDTESIRELEEAGVHDEILSQMHGLSQQAQSIGMEAADQFDVSENENAVCVFGALGGAALGFGAIAMPAMLLYSFMKSDEAKAAYYEAKTRMDEAKIYEEKCNNMSALFKAISTRGEQIENLLYRLNDYFVPSVESLSWVVDNYGVDYRQYTVESKMKVFYAFQLAQTVKNVVETSMFQEDWSINPDIERTMEIGHKTIALLSDNE